MTSVFKDERLEPPRNLPSPVSDSMPCPRNRAYDLLFSLIGTALFAPGFLLFACLIYAEDRGPVFFRQHRIGLDQNPFSILKFRTMRSLTVTAVGRWLRRTGLDESAQFINVLCGDMSMVGPRPLTREDVDRLGWTGPRFVRRWSVKPGITGLAQVFGGRSAAHSRRLDDLYLRTRSPWLDTQLILISFAMNLLGKQRVRGWIRNFRVRRRVQSNGEELLSQQI